jgi:hypothetical protein
MERRVMFSSHGCALGEHIQSEPDHAPASHPSQESREPKEDDKQDVENSTISIMARNRIINHIYSFG